MTEVPTVVADRASDRPDPPVSVLFVYPVAVAMRDRSTDEEIASTPQDPPADPIPSNNNDGPRPTRPKNCLWCWRAMDDERLFASIILVLIVWIGGLGYWAWHIMEIKCFSTVGPTAIEWFSFTAFLAIAALILNSANCALNGILGSVPPNPEPPYSQDQRDKQYTSRSSFASCGRSFP